MLMLLGVVLPVLLTPAAAAAARPQQLSAAAAAASVGLGVNAVRLSDGSMRIFSVSSSGAGYEQVLRGRSWSATSALGGGALRAAPAPIQRGNRLDIFAVRSDGLVMQRTSTANRWGTWRRLPIRGFSGALGATWTNSGDLHLYGTDTSGRVLQAIFRQGRGWSIVQLTPNRLRGNVSLVYSAAENRLDLYSVDSATRITQRTYSGGRWSSWHSISKTGFAGGLVAVRPTPGGWRVIGRGTDNAVYEMTFGARHWRGPVRLGGNAVGHPGAVLIGASGRYFSSGHTAVVSERSIGAPCCSWSVVRRTPAAPQPTTRVELAKALLTRWGGRLSGLAAVRSDLRTTAAGRAIRNGCGQSVHLDAAMLQVVYAASGKYQVFVNNMVSGRGCDSGFHPRGMAVDFNTVVDPATGRSTNWHTGSSSDNRALDREFLSYAAAQVRTGGGAGQANCAGSATAPLPPRMLRFDDACNHQHLDTRR